MKFKQREKNNEEKFWSAWNEARSFHPFLIPLSWFSEKGIMKIVF